VWALIRLWVRQVRERLEERMEVRLNERGRIARELHDSLLQGFQGLMFRLQAVRELLPERPGDAVKFLDSAMQVGDRAIGERSDAIQSLRSSSFDVSDLATVLSALHTELGAGMDPPSRPEYGVVVEGQPRELRAVVRDETYRIAREAVYNAYQHAQCLPAQNQVVPQGRSDDQAARAGWQTMSLLQTARRGAGYGARRGAGKSQGRC
jgi:signal transduction histidine kinase